MSYWKMCEAKHKESHKDAELAVQVQLSTFGGRSERVQVRAESVRLCAGCLESLEAGKVPPVLRNAIAKARATVANGGKR